MNGSPAQSGSSKAAHAALPRKPESPRVRSLFAKDAGAFSIYLVPNCTKSTIFCVGTVKNSLWKLWKSRLRYMQARFSLRYSSLFIGLCIFTHFLHNKSSISYSSLLLRPRKPPDTPRIGAQASVQFADPLSQRAPSRCHSAYAGSRALPTLSKTPRGAHFHPSARRPHPHVKRGAST